MAKDEVNIFEQNLLKNHLSKNLNFLFEFNNKITLGHSCGIESVDDITEGFFGLTAVTGVPGKGKTTFAVQAVIHNVLVLKKPVLYVSLEVNKDMLISKIISNRIKVPIKRILKGQMNQRESEEYIKCLNQLMEHDNLMILDTTDASFENIEKGIAYLKEKFLREEGVAEEVLVVLDYLNIFYDYGPDGGKEKEKSDRVSRQMAEFIKLKNETKSNFIIITAKNKQGYKTAELSSIKGPNDLEYGFETIISLEEVDEDFPLSDYPPNEKTLFESVNTLMVIMKNRWGETNKKIPLVFLPHLGEFVSPE